ncbi:hypothetical protein HY637_03505 [Candidatus Woesearchaeota archaeon]|nr:hypothetical protein [Candidatus Woesearchaeota archaeon]
MASYPLYLYPRIKFRELIRLYHGSDKDISGDISGILIGNDRIVASAASLGVGIPDIAGMLSFTPQNGYASLERAAYELYRHYRFREFVESGRDLHQMPLEITPMAKTKKYGGLGPRVIDLLLTALHIKTTDDLISYGRKELLKRKKIMNKALVDKISSYIREMGLELRT